MRYIRIAAAGMLVSAALFSSCTCHKQVSAPPTSSFEIPPAGFHAAGPKITPHPHIAVQPALTPPPQVAQAGPTPTAPANVPADFPAEVPIFKDASLAQVQDLANNAHNVIFTTPSALPDVASFYQERMTQAGFRVTQQYQRPDHAFFTFQKGDLIANLTVAPDVNDPTKQIIAIMYEHQKKLDFDEF